MSTKEQSQESQEQSAAVEYSYKTDILVLIKAVSKETYKGMIEALTTENDAFKMQTEEMTDDEYTTEQVKIKKEYMDVLRRIRKGGNSPEQIELCTKIASLHLRITARSNYIQANQGAENWDPDDEEFIAHFMKENPDTIPMSSDESDGESDSESDGNIILGSGDPSEQNDSDVDLV